MTVFGTWELYIDDESLVDNEIKQRSGGSFFNVGTVEESGTKRVVAGQTYKLKVIYASGVTSKLVDADDIVSFGGGGMRIGGARVIDPWEEIEKAVEMARNADQVVLSLGLNFDFLYLRLLRSAIRKLISAPYGRWQSCSSCPIGDSLYKRDCYLGQLSLIRRRARRPRTSTYGSARLSDELITAVAKANPRTVVVLQAETPVTMRWADDVAGIVQAWYGEMRRVMRLLMFYLAT